MALDRLVAVGLAHEGDAVHQGVELRRRGKSANKVADSDSADEFVIPESDVGPLAAKVSAEV